MKDKFIEKANNKYNNKFEYSKFKYTNAKTKSIIICPEHGEFLQNPDKHLTSKYGCQECALIGRSQTSKGKVGYKPLKYTWNEMKSKLKSKFPMYEFTCSSYHGTQSKIELHCSEHGNHTTSPHGLLHGHVKFGCPKCADVERVAAKTKTFEDFLKDAYTVHGDKYTYTCKDFINRKSKILCTCDIHGEFTKSAQKLLSGQGCFKCKVDALTLEGKLPGGYCETIFRRSEELQNKPGILYYLKIKDTYKIGITINLKQRIKALKSKFNSEITVIDTYELPLYEAYKLEQDILKQYAKHRISTEQSTELFSEDVLNGRILK